MTNVVKINAKACRKVINCNQYSNIDPEDFEGLVLYDMNKNRDTGHTGPIGDTFGLKPITYIEDRLTKTLVVMRVDVMNQEIYSHHMYKGGHPLEVHVVDDDGNASRTLCDDMIMWNFKIQWIGPSHNQKWKIHFPDADYYNHK